MKYLISGVVTFLIYLTSLYLPNHIIQVITPLQIKSWSIAEIIIAVLFVFCGIQTMRLEKKYIAGILFFILAIVTLMTIALGNSQI